MGAACKLATITYVIPAYSPYAVLHKCLTGRF
jgi:hypothetical protein